MGYGKWFGSAPPADVNDYPGMNPKIAVPDPSGSGSDTSVTTMGQVAGSSSGDITVNLDGNGGGSGGGDDDGGNEDDGVSISNRVTLGTGSLDTVGPCYMRTLQAMAESYAGRAMTPKEVEDSIKAY